MEEDSYRNLEEYQEMTRFAGFEPVKTLAQRVPKLTDIDHLDPDNPGPRARPLQRDAVRPGADHRCNRETQT